MESAYITSEYCEPYYKRLDDPWTNSIILCCKKHGIVGYLNGCNHLVSAEVVAKMMLGIFDQHVRDVRQPSIPEGKPIAELPTHLL